jgi:hypothetical protein
MKQKQIPLTTSATLNPTTTIRNPRLQILHLATSHGTRYQSNSTYAYSSQKKTTLVSHLTISSFLTATTPHKPHRTHHLVSHRQSIQVPGTCSTRKVPQALASRQGLERPFVEPLVCHSPLHPRIATRPNLPSAANRARYLTLL